MKIIPAILSYSAEDFKRKVALATQMSSAIQVDMIDGSLGGQPTVTIEAISIPASMQVCFHLMHKSPERGLEPYLKFNPCRIIIHAEADIDWDYLKKQLSPEKIAIALNPETELFTISPIIKQIGEVLVMTAITGASGGSFIPPALDKVTEIKQKYPHITTSVDGGINIKTAALAQRAGADVAYVASGIFSQTNPKEAYQSLIKVM